MRKVRRTDRQWDAPDALVCFNAQSPPPTEAKIARRIGDMLRQVKTCERKGNWSRFPCPPETRLA